MRLDTGFGAVDAMTEGDGRDLAVLLHAAGSSPRALLGLAHALIPQGFRVAMPALPMQPMTYAQAPTIGGSVRDVEHRPNTEVGDPQQALARHPLRLQIATVHSALQAADERGAGSRDKPSRRIVFGHSFGGLVALLAALHSDSTTAAKPDALVLYEPIVLDVLDKSDPTDAAARAIDRGLIDGIAAGVANGTPEAGLASFIEAYNEVAWHTLPQKARAVIVADAAAIRDLTQVVHHLPLDRTCLASVTTPVLILSGTRSPAVTQRMAVRLAALLPNATHVRLEGVGHMAPVLAAERVIETISQAFNVLKVFRR